MAWERRQRGGYYYTRSFRVGGRVFREYVGGGLSGQMAAEADRIERERREVEALKEKQEREKVDALAAPVLELCEAAEILVRAQLVAGGYRRYQGKWRRVREQRS
jgi:hypothetical protein